LRFWFSDQLNIISSEWSNLEARAQACARLAAATPRTLETGPCAFRLLAAGIGQDHDAPKQFQGDDSNRPGGPMTNQGVGHGRFGISLCRRDCGAFVSLALRVSRRRFFGV
jgi:hypothetical protein